MGNIKTYTDFNGSQSYTYDELGQLTQAVVGSTTYTYTYDFCSNITSANGKTYTYGNSQWEDLLTAYDGQNILYEGQTIASDVPVSGNPTSYYNGTRWTFDWEEGRNLVTASGNGKEISYTYDHEGVRTSKTVDGTVHNYIYASGKLLRETYDGTVIDFFYDASGRPYAMTQNGTTYYYVLNLQGDVLGVMDGSGNIVAKYKYDPYGNLLDTASIKADIYNPLRYRGYYYDTESNLYYLQSRYYDPAIGRFINADGYASTGQGLLGNNMFAYCNNNPIKYTDPSGEIAIVVDLIIFAAVAIVVVLILVPPPPVLNAITKELTQLSATVTEGNTYAANILIAKTKGKERIKDTGLEQESDEEISRKAHDNKLSKKERQLYKKEEKARGIRNHNKRMELYH